MEKANGKMDGIYRVVNKIESLGPGMVVVGAWFNGGSSPMPVDNVPTEDLDKVCMFGAVPNTVYDGNKYKSSDSLLGFPVQWFSVSKYQDRPEVMDGTTTGITDHIPCLLNLMTLANVIPGGTTVYNTDTGDMVELVPMIQEAENDLQWILDHVTTSEPNAKCNGCKQGECGDCGGAVKGDTCSFMDGFLRHVREANGAIEQVETITDGFHDWLSKVVDDTSVEEIQKTLMCGDPALGDAEINLLKGIVAAKRFGSMLGGNPRTKVAVIGFHKN